MSYELCCCLCRWKMATHGILQFRNNLTKLPDHPTVNHLQKTHWKDHYCSQSGDQALYPAEKEKEDLLPLFPQNSLTVSLLVTWDPKWGIQLISIFDGTMETADRIVWTSCAQMRPVK